MRILFLAPFAAGGPKGTTRWRVLPLARALAAQGHALRVVIPPYDCARQSSTGWQDQGVAVENLALPPFGGSMGQVALAQRLVQAVVAWRPDVVHCFKPKGPAGLAAWLLARRSGWRVPLVVDADDWEAGWNRAAGYPLAWRVFFRWQERWGLRRADAVTAASRWLVDYAALLRRGAAPWARPGDDGVFYLPNGVDPVALGQAPGGTGQGRTVLAYTRLVEHTPQLLVEVWLKVLRAEGGARLVVAGLKPGFVADRLVEAARAGGVSHSILMAGWVPAASRSGLFAAVDAALLPVADTPLNRAKSPMRLLDLLAAGVPVATQEVGEFGRVVCSGTTGLVTQVDDADALAAATARLLRDDPLRRRLGQAAAASMRTDYAWPGLARRAMAAYEALERTEWGAG